MNLFEWILSVEFICLFSLVKRLCADLLVQCVDRRFRQSETTFEGVNHEIEIDLVHIDRAGVRGGDRGDGELDQAAGE